MLFGPYNLIFQVNEVMDSLENQKVDINNTGLGTNVCPYKICNKLLRKCFFPLISKIFKFSFQTETVIPFATSFNNCINQHNGTLKIRKVIQGFQSNKTCV